MPVDVQAKQPTVFISYAHESDELRNAVKALGDWLGRCGCTVLTDHLHRDRPPPEGWQAWMLGCINRADTVLVVCTPGLKARYEKTEDIDIGRGATYEGAIVTQHIYDRAMRNTKFFPILPDGGSHDDIPVTLRPWSNGHLFPSGNAGIRRLISNDDSASGDDSEPDESSFANAQEAMTIRLLGAQSAQPFLAILKKEIAKKLMPGQAPASAEEIIFLVRRCSTEKMVQEFFYAVRRALKAARTAIQAGPGLRSIDETAAALYLLAACRLVARAADEQNASAGPIYVLKVPNAEPVICAIIATALFGGELRLSPSGESDRPGVEYVFDVKPHNGDDQKEYDFERAVYFALFPNDRSTTTIALDSGPLKPAQRARLAAYFDNIREVEERSFALVVSGFTHEATYKDFAIRHNAPVMLPTNAATTALLGMDADRLLEEILHLWKMVETFRRSD
jgi:hypothetical protein